MANRNGNASASGAALTRLYYSWYYFLARHWAFGIAMAIMFVIYNLYVYVYVHVQKITILVTIYKVSLL